MPCTAPPRGITDPLVRWSDWIDNNPCGKPDLAYGLCKLHYEMRYGPVVGTPPSGGLVDAQTALLIHADGADASTAFYDSSPSPKPVTAQGTAKVTTAQSKFGGASLLCDGVTSTITTPDHPDFNFGTGDFTIDFWWRPNGITGFHSLAGKSTGATGGSWWLAMSGADLYLYMSSQTASWDIANAFFVAPALSIGSWYHIAIVRQGNAFTTYKDGVQVYTWTSALAVYPGTDPVVFGSQQSGAGGGAPGWLDEIRISKGIARWTAPFTPPPAPYADTAPVLLLHCNGSNGSTAFPDASPSGKVITAGGDAKIDTSQSKFGGASAVFDGTGDSLSTPDAPDLELGAGDFTIDFWVRPTNVTSNTYWAGKSDGGTGWAFWNGAGGNLTFYAGTGAGWDIANALLVGAPTINAWNHVAVTRQGSTIRTFLNGVQGGTVTSALAIQDNTLPTTVAAYSPGAAGLTGWIDEFRISKVARWTANFTPPTGPYA